MAKMTTLTLTNISFDVQISICMYLHPSDILALRKTCKAFQLSTRERVVWVDALHRVCLENSLFLPTFPISDMSNLEIEKAAMGPRRWIDLCGAFEKQHLNDPDATLRPPRTTRIINDSFPTKVDYTNTDFYIVPGGRYLVKSSPKDLSVLDLGYTSSAKCKLIASVRLAQGGKSNKYLVQTTPDGMGLVILLHNNEKKYSVYEIYPQSETPQLTRIAHVDFESTMDELYLLPGKVFWYERQQKRIDFKVWDYRLPLNRSINFSLDVDAAEVLVTKTAIIVICEDEVLIWPSDSFDHNPTHTTTMPPPPPLITLPFPDGTAPERHIWTTLSSWYFFSSSQPLYFDMVSQDEEAEFFILHKFKLIIEPDLSTASIHTINITEFTMEDYSYLSLEGFRICEDTLVSCWVYDDYRLGEYQCGVYTGLTSPSPEKSAHAGISHGGPCGRMLLPDVIEHRYMLYGCPASGRFVRLDGGSNVAVLDFF